MSYGGSFIARDLGGDYLREAETLARSVAIITANGALTHEGAYFNIFADIERAGAEAPLFSGSYP
jgi:hypothetical protein